MSKFLNVLFVLFFCISISISIRFYGFDGVLRKKSFFIEHILKKFKFSRTLKILSFFYRIKLSSCLVSAVIIKKLKKEDEKFKLIIGVLRNNKIFKSHAWVEYKFKPIFGNLKNLDDYKLIYINA